MCWPQHARTLSEHVLQPSGESKQLELFDVMYSLAKVGRAGRAGMRESDQIEPGVTAAPYKEKAIALAQASRPRREPARSCLYGFDPVCWTVITVD